tara:strand:+ start:2812 stop:2979 length:168 start_codon:yes stop_codon:yes gene_type:complete
LPDPLGLGPAWDAEDKDFIATTKELGVHVLPIEGVGWQVVGDAGFMAHKDWGEYD